jgi:NTP pyrophosphatase (non-canonical NTP hydrolase)
MEDHYNMLTPAEAERLSLLLEEMGESIQIIGKIQRHGYESYHPDSGPVNRELLEKELGHVMYAVKLLCGERDLSTSSINWYRDKKEQSISQWLHHQP